MPAADVTHRTEVMAVTSTMNAGATVHVWLLKKETMSANSLTSVVSLQNDRNHHGYYLSK